MTAPPATEGRLPDFLIVGAMRSGTTSLYRYLGAHPEIFMTPKELQFFTVHYDKGFDWYRSQFSATGRARVLGEPTADYLARESAMNRIVEALPQARLVASLRNPVDRAWSHYGLFRSRGREPRPFGRALDEELAAVARSGPDADGVVYLAHGLYDHHLERAYRLFPREQIHVAIFERMAADPHATYAAVCDFLGVDPTFVPSNLGTPVNAFVTFRSLNLRRLSQRVPGIGGRVIGRLNTKRDVAPPPLDPDQRRLLEEFYAPHIERTERCSGSPSPNGPRLQRRQRADATRR